MPEENRIDSSRREASSSPGESPAAPRLVGHYSVLKELGRGAQGVVYLAEHTQLRRKVALKMLTAAAAQSEGARARFQREAELASKLEHPGICGVHEVGDVNGVPYMAMQYLSGATLAEVLSSARVNQTKEKRADGESPRTASSSSLLDRTGKVAMEDVVSLIERAARALHAAHEVGLVHRDMKPGNIMVSPDGSPVLLDFGLARDIGADGQTLTESGQIIGTPAYLAPEQIIAQRGQVDRRADIYSLGVTLYECLTLQRPFEAEGWDQLFHKILEGGAASPKRLNPRIPPDLNTVVEVAMDREPARRYATAEAFAEDLRKVRAFEPINAKGLSPITRVRRWARRRPAVAVTIAAVLVFAVAGAGLVLAQGVARVRAVGGHIRRAERLLAESNYAEALEAVARAREREPESAAALALKSRIEQERDRAETQRRMRVDLAAAAAAREESTRKQEEHATARAAMEDLQREIDAQRGAAFAMYSADALRGAFARKERDLEMRRVTAERLLQEAQEALERAVRREAPWGGMTPESEAAFAAFYFGRWKEAVAAEDSARVAWLRTAVESYDQAGNYRHELHGRGTLTIEIDPPDAEVFLFRYEPYESVRADDPVPRLVPVPTTGIGRAVDGPWIADFHPGDLCLAIDRVEPDSLAAGKSLRPGDLIVRLNDMPVGEGLFFLGAPPNSALAAAGARPLSGILSLNGVPVTGAFDWATTPAAAGDDKTDRVRLSGLDGEVDCLRKEVSVGKPLDLVQGAAPADMSLLCLRDGEAVTLEVPAGRRAGVRCAATAFPLIRSAKNRILARTPIDVDPGRYLVVARRGGFEDQRFSLLIERNARVVPELELLEAGRTPPDFAYVPAGSFVYGGDPEAFKAGRPEHVSLPGFFIARKEVTNREWFEFVNDEATLEAIEAESPPRKYLPREPGKLLAKKTNGNRYEWIRGLPETPVYGISWNDVNDYLEWRNRRARQAGERWTYDLPTQHEWEKAARGADGRLFPWGDRFDFSLCVSAYRKNQYLLDAPGGFEPRDESPFGMLDMGGGRQEWTRDAAPFGSEGEQISYHMRGGAWGQAGEGTFRSAGRAYGDADHVSGYTGLRLVVRPIP